MLCPVLTTGAMRQLARINHTEIDRHLKTKTTKVRIYDRGRKWSHENIRQEDLTIMRSDAEVET